MGLADKAIAALVRGARVANVVERRLTNNLAGPIGRKTLTPQPLIPKRHLGKTSAIVPRWYMMPKDIRYEKDGNKVTNAYFGGTDITKSLEKGQGIPWGTQASEWNLLRRKMAEESGTTPNIINDNPLTDTSWQWRDNARLAGVPKGPDMRPYGEAERAKGKQVLGATALAAGAAKKAVDFFSNMKDSYESQEEGSNGQ